MLRDLHSNSWDPQVIAKVGGEPNLPFIFGFVCLFSSTGVVVFGFFSYYVLLFFSPSRAIHYSFKSLCYFSAKGSLSSTLPLSLEVHIALIALISEEHFRINDYSTASPLFCRLLKIK